MTIREIGASSPCMHTLLGAARVGTHAHIGRIYLRSVALSILFLVLRLAEASGSGESGCMFCSITWSHMSKDATKSISVPRALPLGAFFSCTERWSLATATLMPAQTWPPSRVEFNKVLKGHKEDLDSVI